MKRPSGLDEPIRCSPFLGPTISSTTPVPLSSPQARAVRSIAVNLCGSGTSLDGMSMFEILADCESLPGRTRRSTVQSRRRSGPVPRSFRRPVHCRCLGQRETELMTSRGVEFLDQGAHRLVCRQDNQVDFSPACFALNLVHYRKATHIFLFQLPDVCDSKAASLQSIPGYVGTAHGIVSKLSSCA